MLNFGEIQNIVKNEEVNEDGIDLEKEGLKYFEEIIQKEKEKYQQFSLQVGEKVFEFWKDLKEKEEDQVRN